MNRSIGAVLAGGRGRRMGGDKASLEVGGRTLVRRAVDALAQAGLEAVLVLRADQAVPAEAGSDPVLRDQVADAGPLAGLHAVLDWLTEDWTLVVACDQPFLTPELLRGLTEQPRERADAVVGRTLERREPLPGLYRRTCLPVVERMLARGDRDLKALLNSIRLHEVSVEMLRGWDPELLSYVNVNTPDELERARALAAAVGGECHYS